MKLDERLDVCPVCGSDCIYEYLRDDRSNAFNLQYMKCSGCETVFLNPRMGEEETRNFYRGEYRKFIAITNENAAVVDSYRQKVRGEVIASLVETPIASHLDIGCSRGFMLLAVDAARKVGVEWNEAEYRLCQSRGIDMYKEVEDLPDEKYDLITIIQVLEHVDYPTEIISRLLGLLKDDGILLVEVPNSDEEFGMTPVHPIMFTATSLKNTLEIAGGQVEQIVTYNCYRPDTKPYYILAEVRKHEV